MLAGFLLAASSCLRALSLPHPTADDVLEATGSTRSRAYELRDRVLGALPALERARGRPPKPVVDRPTDVAADLGRETLRYLMDHPGAVSPDGHRRHYSDGFRRFALELCERHADLDVDVVAGAIEVPPTTLREWRRAGAHAYADPSSPAHAHEPTEPPIAEAPAPALEPIRDLHLQTVLDAWRTWRGPFTAFCDHVQQHHHVRFGRAAIASILQHAGVRLPARRRGRSPDEQALHRSFETFFPGAQWTGDGSPIRVFFEGELFVFNLELVVDTAAAAAVGIDVRDHEDAAAVVAAFADGIATTGAAPLALLLDNKPSNHTPEVDHALGDTVRMRATVARPQNKAHVEGAFGLFSQVAPPVVIDAPEKHERARQVLELQARTWARTLNHRPRDDHHGRSRFDLYKDAVPSAEDVERAREALVARAREHELAHETCRARHDPIVARVLDDAFTRLGLDDPQRHLRNAIARYPLERIVEGIATFEGKRSANTLPAGVDARYLLGIVRNLAHEHEGMAIAMRLWDLRLQARDHVFSPLRAEQDLLQRQHGAADERLRVFVDRGLATDRGIDRFFWLTCAVDLVRDQPADMHRSLFHFAARRIHATHRVPHHDRLRATRFLAAKLLPLA
ncbi:MAG: hypothetical protein ACREI7_00855 [Myxococcota bacterium]